MIDEESHDGMKPWRPNAKQYGQSTEEVKAVAQAGIDVSRQRLGESAEQPVIQSTETSQVDVTASVDRSKLPPTVAEIRQQVADAAAQQQAPPNTAA